MKNKLHFSNPFKFAAVPAIIVTNSYHKCSSAFICLIAVVISATLAWQIFSVMAAKHWLLLFTALCSSVVNKGLLLFLISSALPPATFCFWKPWFVVRSLELEPARPAPSPASKLVVDEKFMTAMPISFEVLLLFFWCCPHWWWLHLQFSFDRPPHSQWECKSGREAGTVSMALLHWYSLIKGFFSPCCSRVITGHWLAAFRSHPHNSLRTISALYCSSYIKTFHSFYC